MDVSKFHKRTCHSGRGTWTVNTQMLGQLRGPEDLRNQSKTTKGVVFTRNPPKDFIYNVTAVSALGLLVGISKAYFKTWDQKVQVYSEVRKILVTETVWYGVYAATFFGAREAYWSFFHQDDIYASFSSGFACGLANVCRYYQHAPIRGLSMAGILGVIVSAGEFLLNPKIFGDLHGEAYVMNRQEAFDRYKSLAEKHKKANDAILFDIDRESFAKLQENTKS